MAQQIQPHLGALDFGCLLKSEFKHVFHKEPGDPAGCKPSALMKFLFSLESNLSETRKRQPISTKKSKNKELRGMLSVINPII